MSISAFDVLNTARKQGWALGAFNAANIETLKAIVQAADVLRAPVIVESSGGETNFFGADEFASIVAIMRRKHNLPIFINLDHAEQPEAIDEAIKVGYDLIHFDGGRLPYKKNVEIAKEVANKAHKKGLLVEGEMDHIGGSSAAHLNQTSEEAQKEGRYTDPEKAASFVQETGVDIFAAFFGNVHGVFATPPKLDFDRLARLTQQVPAFLSMHGGSGIRDEDVKQAIKTGRIVKINVNTEMRIAYKKTLKKVINTTDEVAAYKFMPPVIEAVQKVVEKKIRLFGSAGKADIFR